MSHLQVAYEVGNSYTFLRVQSAVVATEMCSNSLMLSLTKVIFCKVNFLQLFLVIFHSQLLNLMI